MQFKIIMKQETHGRRNFTVSSVSFIVSEVSRVLAAEGCLDLMDYTHFEMGGVWRQE
jgi:hypothetical protein